MSIKDVFDAWEPLIKARYDGPLEEWDGLENIAKKLEGKEESHFSFVCIHPSHENLEKSDMGYHALGSVEGNQHFLTGYGSPHFHVMPYHFQIIDPELNDEMAKALCGRIGNPANMDLWLEEWGDSTSEFVSGELEKGKPHKDVHKYKSTLSWTVNGMKYGAVTKTQMVHSPTHQYKWDVVKDSYIASQMPEEYKAKMDRAAKKAAKKQKAEVPEMVKHQCSTAEDEFSAEVYPLVRSEFPKPGSVIPVELPSSETVYGVVKGESIDFCDKLGHPVGLNIYDKAYFSLDLRKGGNIHPSILYTFASKYVYLDEDLIKSLASTAVVEVPDFPSVVVGNLDTE